MSDLSKLLHVFVKIVTWIYCKGQKYQGKVWLEKKHLLASGSGNVTKVWPIESNCWIRPSCDKDFSKVLYGFVEIGKCIFLSCQSRCMDLSNFLRIFVKVILCVSCLCNGLIRCPLGLWQCFKMHIILAAAPIESEKILLQMSIVLLSASLVLLLSSPHTRGSFLKAVHFFQ